MKIEHLKEAIMLCRAAGVTPFIWGHRGLGKSSVVKQTAQEHGLGFIDMRCSQMEASDIRGLPDRENGQTVFRPPADLPVGGMTYDEYVEHLNNNPEDAWKLSKTMQNQLNEGILFLDELNRAQDDVIQAIFQLVLDRSIGQYVLPPGWCIVVAGNFMEGYMTNGFNDPAFLDRFCHVTLSDGELTLEEWVNYITGAHGADASTVVEFATQNIKHLDGDVRGDLGFSVQPSRRSWDAVIRIDKAYRDSQGEFAEDTRLQCVAGLVGHDIAIAYSRYDCPVKPKQIIDRGVKAMEKQLASLSRNQMTGLMWGLASMLKGKVHEEKMGKIAVDFVRWMCNQYSDKDIVVAFCNIMIGTGGDQSKSQLRSAMIVNPKVAQLIGKARQHRPSKRAFVDYLNEAPDLQELLADTALGNFIARDQEIRGK